MVKVGNDFRPGRLEWDAHQSVDYHLKTLYGQAGDLPRATAARLPSSAGNSRLLPAERQASVGKVVVWDVPQLTRYATGQVVSSQP